MAYTTINKSTAYFNTKLYTGNGGTQSITGVGFQPDFCWFKRRDTGASNHALQDVVRGVTKFIQSNTTSAEATSSNYLTSFNSDGFSLAGDGDVNENNANHVSWNWKAGTGQGSANTDGTINSTYTSANTTAGFSIVKYNGSGTAGTVGHGLGAVPKMIIIKEISGNASGGNQAWSVYHVANGNTHNMNLNTTSGKIDDIDFNDTTPTSSVFSVGSQNRVNSGNGNGVYVAYCFAEKTGYSKFGSYVGNGNADGTFVYTGFSPAFLMVKRTDTTGVWGMYDNKRIGYNTTQGVQNVLRANSSDATATGGGNAGGYGGIDFLSNGFKGKLSDGNMGASGGTYIYMAFGQSIVGTNGVTAKAR